MSIDLINNNFYIPESLSNNLLLKNIISIYKNTDII